MLDGIPADEMTQEQLVDHLGRIKEELDREREERNFFQLERDKIHTFWEITRRQLEERKAELRNKVKISREGFRGAKRRVNLSFRIEKWKRPRSVTRLRSRFTSKKQNSCFTSTITPRPNYE